MLRRSVASSFLQRTAHRLVAAKSIHEAKAEFWHSVETPLRSPRIQCTLCPRKCLLKDGQRGFCYVRMNDKQQMTLQTYGRSSGFCVDPIEKKPLYHYFPGSDILSFGTAGCNLGCKFCQNWDISKATTDDRLQSQVSVEAIALAAYDLGCPAVAMTYNDPVIFYEYARDTATACRKRGIKAVAVTAGYLTNESREPFFSNFDATNVDLKAFTEDFYRSVCKASLQPVLDTLSFLGRQQQLLGVKASTWFEITTLVIPSKNDSVKEIENLCRWVLQHCGPFTPIHFTAFHPDWNMREIQPTPISTLLQCHDIATRCGLHYVYTGNIQHAATSTTYCHHCREPLISRAGFTILKDEQKLGDGIRISEEGRCHFCDTQIPGFFSSAHRFRRFEASPKTSVHCSVQANRSSARVRKPFRVNMDQYMQSKN